jgi:hypothetical protein
MIRKLLAVLVDVEWQNPLLRREAAETAPAAGRTPLGVQVMQIPDVARGPAVCDTQGALGICPQKQMRD